MKKIFLTIIMTLGIISNLFLACVSADDGRLGELLEIRTGPEVYFLESIPQLTPNRFDGTGVSRTFREFQNIDNALRGEFITRYRQGYYTYYEMRDLVESYKKFLYHTNKAFELIEMQSQGYTGKEMQNALYLHYSNLRKYFIEVQRLSK